MTNVPFFILIYLLLLLVFVVGLIVFHFHLNLEKERKMNKIHRGDLAKFKMVVANSSDQVIITDKDGIVIYANRALEKLTGYSVKEAIGTKAGKLWGGLMPKKFYQRMWRIISVAKKSFAAEIKNKRKDGQEYYAKINVNPILDEYGEIKFFMAVETDVTQAKELEQIRSDIVSVTSHQLRTPLTVSKGYLSMLLDGTFGTLNQDQSAQLFKIYESNERLIYLIQDLMSISSFEAGKMKFSLAPEDLSEIVGSVMEEVKSLAVGKGLTLKFSPPAGLPKVNVDAPRIRQVILNLVDNAIKYTMIGSIEVSLENLADKVKFTVKDTGLGIKEADIKELFTQYSRGSKENMKTIRGTGLGLYVAKIMIEAQGGRIWVESEGENKGSTFCFELPVATKVDSNTVKINPNTAKVNPNTTK